ncbi:MAG TPA: hypothetical protein VHG72_02455 [Polyangia bacterium]|nr:hypothetical protein [Polyangia bacterium]
MTTGTTLSSTTSTPVAAGETYGQTAAGVGGSGSLTVTALTAARTVGTFSETLPVTAGRSATSPPLIANGVFNIQILEVSRCH